MITPPGEGGIAALRLAGRKSLSFFQSHFRATKNSSTKVSFKPFVMRHGYFVARDGSPVDEITAVYMPAGKSYTGLEQVEIFCHGGRHVVGLIQDEIIKSGARVAEPGEFTKLAFLSGRIELSKAEAVAEIIAANTDSSFVTAREHLLGAYTEHLGVLRNQLVELTAEIEASIDFPEEEINPSDSQGAAYNLDHIIASIKELVASYTGGRIINEGYKIAIGGRPNVGKSSLFNLLLSQERALVTPTAGTTRDYLSEWIDLGGYKVNIIDTAGLRKGGGEIEKAGQESARKIIDQSDLLLWMVDLSDKNWKKQQSKAPLITTTTTILLIGNKLDVAVGGPFEPEMAMISCKTGKGLPELKRRLIELIGSSLPDLTDGLIVTSARHKQKLAESLKGLRAARKKLLANDTPELTAFDLRRAVGSLDEITGRIYNEEILGRIFSKFCVGK